MNQVKEVSTLDRDAILTCWMQALAFATEEASLAAAPYDQEEIARFLDGYLQRVKEYENFLQLLIAFGEATGFCPIVTHDETEDVWEFDAYPDEWEMHSVQEDPPINAELASHLWVRLWKFLLSVRSFVQVQKVFDTPRLQARRYFTEMTYMVPVYQAWTELLSMMEPHFGFGIYPSSSQERPWPLICRSTIAWTIAETVDDEP